MKRRKLGLFENIAIVSAALYILISSVGCTNKTESYELASGNKIELRYRYHPWTWGKREPFEIVIQEGRKKHTVPFKNATVVRVSYIMPGEKDNEFYLMGVVCVESEGWVGNNAVLRVDAKSGQVEDVIELKYDSEKEGLILYDDQRNKSPFKINADKIIFRTYSRNDNSEKIHEQDMYK